jgi:hypothetical protein
MTAHRRIRVEVTDQFGTAALILDMAAVDGMTAWKRARLNALADGFIQNLAAVLGTGETHAHEVAIAELCRLVADEDAYERVAERRGLLPL